MMPIFDSKMYMEAYSSLHASDNTLEQVMKRAAGTGNAKKKLLPAFAALLALTVSVIAFAGGGMLRGAWRFQGTLKDMEEMGVCRPEKLGEYHVDQQSVSRFHVVKAKTNQLKAFFKPDYVWMSVTYEKNSRQGLSVSCGKTDDPLWAYVSHYDLESGVWDGVLRPETLTRHDESQGSVTYIDHVTEHTYRNCVVYVYDEITEYMEPADATDTELSLPNDQEVCAVWTDLDSGLWFHVNSFHPLRETNGEDSDMENGEEESIPQEEMLGYVKEMIDGCR